MSNSSTITLSVLGTLAVIATLYGSAKVYSKWQQAEKNRALIANYSYDDNPQYGPAVAMASLYNMQANIVMLGDSHSRISWNELLDRSDVAVRAVGGDITAGFIARLDQVIELKPKMVFIEGGINDICLEIKPSTIVKNIKTICETLKAAGIEPVITMVPYVAPKYNDATRVNQAVAGVNKELKIYADKLMLFYIDLNGSISNNGYLEPKFCQNDNIHLNAKAYRFWGNSISAIFESNILGLARHKH